MTIDISTIGVEFQTDGLKRGERAMTDAERAAYKMADQLEIAERQTRSLSDATQTMGRIMGGALSGLGLGQLVSQIDAYTKLTSQLKLAAVGNAEYVRSLEDVRKIATASQSDLQATATLYARIKTGVAELGIGQAKVSQITEATTLSLKISGATAAESASAMLQLSQAFASGTLRGEEFNAVNEATPRLMKALADGMGVAVGSLKEMASNGQITSAVMADALPRALADLRKEAESVQTISGAFVVLKNNVLEFVGASAQANGVAGTLASAIGLVANNLNLIAGAAVGFAAAKLAQSLAGAATAAYASAAATNATLAANITAAQSAVAYAAATHASAQANSLAVASTLAKIEASNAALVVSRAEAIAQLGSANATMAVSQAQIQAARSAGALSFALAVLREGEAALAIATAARSAATAELAVLGAQQVAVTAAIATATAAQTAATAAATATLASETAALQALTVAEVEATAGARALSGAMAFIGGPIGAITALLGLGVAAWFAWGSGASESEKKAAGAMSDATTDVLESLDKQIKKLKERNALADVKINVNGMDMESAWADRIGALQLKINGLKGSTVEADLVTVNKLLAEQGAIQQRVNELHAQSAPATAAKQEKDRAAAMLEFATNTERADKAVSDMRQKLGSAFTPELEQRMRAKLDPQKKEHVKAVADEYAKLSAEIAKQLALSQAELDGNGKLEASEKYRITTLEKLIEQYQAGKITLKEYIDLESKMNDVQGVMEKAEAQAKAAKAAQAAYAESLQYQDDVNKALREEEDARNRIRLAVGANTVSAEEAQQLAQLEMQTVFASAEDRKRILDYYRIELDLRKKIEAINDQRKNGLDNADELIAIETANAARLKGVSDMGAAMQSTTSIWQSIDQTAHSVWTNVLQGGQDIWSKLKNTAKTIFFDWLYQMTLKKWIFSIGATVSGSGAMAQTAGASGGVSSALSLGSSAANFLGLNSATGLGSLFGSSASYGAAIGTTSIGAGSQAAMLAAQTGEFGAAGALATSSAAAGGGAGIMATLGPAMPYIAAAAGVYMLAKGMGGGESRSGATYTSDAKGQAVYNQGPSGGEISADQSRGLFGSTQTEINRLLAGFGSKATVSGFTAGLESSKNGKGFQFSGGYIGDKAFGENLGRTGGQFSMQSQDDATALANYSTDLQRSVLEALQAADLGGSVGAWLNSLGDIEKLSKEQVATDLAQVTAYQQLQAASKTFPESLGYIKDMSIQAATKLMEFSGGIDGLQSSLSTYFDLFGTEAEKQSLSMQSVKAGFDAINVVMPASNANLREWYKSEVARLGAMDLGVEANAKAYAGALKLASGVDALAKAEEQAAATKQSWQDQLNVLTGKTTDTALQMQRDLASTTDESTQALIRAVYAEKDRQKAMSESATAMQKLATDQAAAAQKSADAYKSALSAQQSYYASLTSAGDAVRNLLAGLKTGVNAGTSPQSRLDAARAQYLQDLSAARGGDFAAYNRVATTAQTYIGAGSDMYASSAEQKAILAQVQSELQNLPAVSQYDANLAQLKAIEAAIKDGGSNTVAAIQAQQFDTLAAINSMTATLSSSFGSIDANSNGMLTFDELKAGLSVGDTLTQQLINAIDTNGDGQISKLEIIAANTFGLDTLARINASVNSINWTDKAAAVAQFTPLAQANGWTLQQIAAATGYNLSDIQALFSGSPLATGMNAKGFSSTSKTGSTAASPIGISSGPSDASWAGTSNGLSAGRAADINTAVQALDWNNKAGAATDIWNKAYYLGWSEQDIATATGYNLSDIDALFKNAGLPAFATGGTHIGGLRIVGENGPELEATGPSRIWNASDTANMLRGGGGDNQALINEVRELRKEVAKSKESDTPIHVTVMTHDGKKLAEQVISTIKERSRNREVVIYANGVGAATR